MARNKDLQIFDRSLKDFLFDSLPSARTHGLKLMQSATKYRNALGRVYNPTPLQVEAVSWAMNTIAWRRLMIVDSGYLGLCPADTSIGDKVARIAGCDTPLVLRPFGNCFKVVGECYLHDLTCDDEIVNNHNEMETIKLC